MAAFLGRGSLVSTAASHASGATVRLVYVFTSGPVPGRENNADWRQDLEPPRGLSQKIEIERGHSELGTINFTIQDVNEFVTDILKQNSIAFRNKIMRFLVGYQDIQESDFLLKANLRNREIKLSPSLNSYVFKGIDIQRSLRDRIIMGATLLNGSITASTPGVGAELNVDGTTNFSIAGHVLIDDELIAYSAKTAMSFTVSERGAEGTMAASHGDDVEVNEVLIEEGNPIDLLLRHMLTD